MDNNSNQFQYISTSRGNHVPGLKVSYGSAAATAGSYGAPGNYKQNGKAASSNMFLDLAETAPRKGILARMKESFINLVTEEAENERPIGISQLSSQTFRNTALADYDLPASIMQGRLRTIVKTGRETNDYRFNQLADHR